MFQQSIEQPLKRYDAGVLKANTFFKYTFAYENQSGVSLDVVIFHSSRS